ncbi:hypothetical protein HNQ71_007115 [Mesorhizobium sangaii]|uniref:Uncharacterized protein n=1 Tax=Mesorhizobium sangaii TaxID=505389 RepID=A0A841PZE2_9HYPH|nr:hypothetical protein [Mesorhizobium sangaii]
MFSAGAREGGMGSWRHVPADLVEIKLHGLGVGKRQRQRRT